MKPLRRESLAKVIPNMGGPSCSLSSTVVVISIYTRFPYFNQPFFWGGIRASLALSRHPCLREETQQEEGVYGHTNKAQHTYPHGRKCSSHPVRNLTRETSEYHLSDWSGRFACYCRNTRWSAVWTCACVLYVMCLRTVADVYLAFGNLLG